MAKKMPEPQTDETKIYRVTITTDRGSIVMDLDPQLAPNTVNNFIGLARQGTTTRSRSTGSCPSS